MAQGKPASKQQTSKKTDQQALMQFDVNFQQATQNRDQAALERMVADGYTLVDHKGEVVDKEHMIAAVMSDEVNIDTFQRSEDIVQLHGKETAVWTSLVTMKGTVQEQGSINGKYRDTATYVKGQGGDWQLAATHLTKVSK